MEQQHAARLGTGGFGHLGRAVQSLVIEKR
jgi:hypothetical protein